MKKNRIVFLIFLLILFMLLTYNVCTKDELIIDNFVYNYLYFNNIITTIMKLVTFLGSKYAVILITIIIIIINRKDGIYISIGLILITLIQIVLKNIFSRPRPIGINLINETGYSYPSGHSLTAMAFYGFLIYLICKSNIKSKNILVIILSIIILLIGISRIYLGVHFTSDVLCGYTVSLLFLIIYITLIERIESK